MRIPQALRSIPLVAVLVASCSEVSPDEAPLAPDCLAALNEGAAAMGEFDFDRAEEAFTRAIEADQSSAIAKLDHAIARLNSTREGAQDEALILFAPLRDDPVVGGRATYCTAMADLFAGRHERALALLDGIAATHGTDAHLHYYRAQCLEAKGDLAAARAGYAKSIALDPYLRSALVGLERCEVREGHAEAAAKWLQEFEAQADNPRSHLAQFKYTRMGALAEVVLPIMPVAEVARGDGPILAPWGSMTVANWPQGLVPTQMLGAPDLNQDGLTDFLWLGRPQSGPVAIVALIGESQRSWRVDPSRTILREGLVDSVKIGDLDNDGRDDLVLTEHLQSSDAHRAVWFHQDEAGSWTERTFGDAARARDKALVIADLDHDGDLDLAVAGERTGALPNTVAILYNRLDGTWERRDILTDEGSPTTQVVVRDLDLDGDLDLVAISRDGVDSRCAVVINDRLWAWRRDPIYAAFEMHGIAAAVSFARASDGAPLIAAAERSGGGMSPTHDLVVWQFGRAAPREIGRRRIGHIVALAAADVTGEGKPLIMVGGMFRDSIFSGFGSELPEIRLFGEDAEPMGSLNGSAANEYEPGQATIVNGTGVILVAGDLRAAFPTATRAPVATISFRGRVDPSQQMRSNASGIGTTGVARVGSSWVPFAALPWDSFLGQSTDPCVIGLGAAPNTAAPSADFLSIEWPDGVLQTERDIKPGARTVVETQRQISSCPVIFAWDGTRMGFVTDCLGVAGLGYLASVSQDGAGVLSGVYAPPRSFERVLLPVSALVAREGSFDIVLAEPMEEFTALDAATLEVHDLPPGWSMSVDERMGISDPQPTGAAIYFREWLVAQDPALHTLDAVAFDPGTIDPRFIGKTVTPFTMPLDFARALDSSAGTPTLLMDGWIEYPYCQTNFAMWQAREALSPPTIEALDPHTGAWQTLAREYGYPAGMPREAAFPLSPESIPAGCQNLRMTTNHELYADRVRVAFAQPCPEAVLTRLDAVSARVVACGFAKRSTLAQRRPHYDYESRAPLWDCRMQRGEYTVLDIECVSLLTAEDGARAVFGAGEGVEIEFADTLPALPRGWTRRFVLELHGYCKDMDALTQNGETVEPLPSAPAKDATEIDARFNHRREGGR